MTQRIAPSIGWSFMLMGIFVGAASLFSLPFTLYRAYAQQQFTPTLGDLAVINSTAFVVTAWIATLLTKRTWRELFSSALPRAAFVPGAVIMALGTAIVCSEIYNITQSLIPMPAFIEKLFETLFDVKASPIGGAVALVVVAPIAEEIVCRRWILESLLQKYRPAIAIVISGLAFGLMHFNPWQFFYAAALGFGIGFLYWRTRSVFLCMLWHAVNNSLVLVFAFWDPDIEGFRRTEGNTLEFHPWWLNAAGAGLVLFGGGLLWWQTRRTLTVADQIRAPQPSESPPPLPLTLPIPPVLPPESGPPPRQDST